MPVPIPRSYFFACHRSRRLACLTEGIEFKPHLLQALVCKRWTLDWHWLVSHPRSAIHHFWQGNHLVFPRFQCKRCAAEVSCRILLPREDRDADAVPSTPLLPWGIVGAATVPWRLSNLGWKELTPVAHVISVVDPVVWCIMMRWHAYHCLVIDVFVVVAAITCLRLWWDPSIQSHESWSHLWLFRRVTLVKISNLFLGELLAIQARQGSDKLIDTPSFAIQTAAELAI